MHRAIVLWILWCANPAVGWGQADAPTPQPFTAEEESELRAADDHLRRHRGPVDEAFLERLFAKAKILSDRDHVIEAAAAFRELIARAPEHPTAEHAANLLLDALNRAGRNDELTRTVRDLRVNNRLLAGRNELVETLERLEIRLEERRISDLERAGRFTECAEAYWRLYEANPEAQGATTFLYNTGVCYEYAHEVDKALAAHDLLVRTRPADWLVKLALPRRARLESSIGQFAEAAAHYEEHATRFPDEKDAPIALRTAAIYRQALGQIAELERVVKLFRRAHGSQMRAVSEELQLGLAEAFGEAGQHKKREALLRRLAGPSKNSAVAALAHARLGADLEARVCSRSSGMGCYRFDHARTDGCRATVLVLRRNQRLRARARRHFEAALRMPVSFGTSASLASERRDALAMARFHLQEPAIESVIEGRVAVASETRVSVQRAALTQLERTYRQINGGVSDRWRIAAAARTGDAYLAMAGRDQTAVGAGAAKPSRDRACVGVGEEWLQEARRAFEECVRLSNEIGGHPAVTQHCDRQLGQLDPLGNGSKAELGPRAGAVGAILGTVGVLDRISPSAP